MLSSKGTCDRFNRNLAGETAKENPHPQSFGFDNCLSGPKCILIFTVSEN